MNIYKILSSSFAQENQLLKDQVNIIRNPIIYEAKTKMNKKLILLICFPFRIQKMRSLLNGTFFLFFKQNFNTN